MKCYSWALLLLLLIVGCGDGGGGAAPAESADPEADTSVLSEEEQVMEDELNK